MGTLTPCLSHCLPKQYRLLSKAQPPYSTTLSGAKAIARAIGAARTTEVRVKSLQEYYKGE